MPTLTSKAIYQDRILIPQIHPPISLPTEAVVVFIPQNNKLTNGSLVLNALKKAKGILPKNFNGIKYEDKVRKLASSEWQTRIKQNKL